MLDRTSQGGITIFILFFTLLPFYSMARDVPESPAGGGCLDLRGGRHGYYYAEDTDNCFDSALLKNGITIEFWFCPARLTERGEWWNLVAKPSLGYECIYQILIQHFLGREGEEWMWLSRDGNSWGIWDIASGKDYEPTWYHVVLQGHGIEIGFSGRGFSGIVFIDGISKGSLGGSSSRFVFNSDHPLYVGGLPAGAQMCLHIGEDYVPSSVTTFDGLIDELRISNVERYDYKAPGEKIKIKERFQPDEHTVALWHFDEGPGTLRYEDASGNGHTLFAAGQLEVTQKRKTPILWGAIKEQKK